ncbi:MAG: hypothetical protein ABI969_00465 [bacterium]
MIFPTHMRRPFVALVPLLVVACGGDTSTAGTSSLPSSPAPVEGAASFAQIQTTILTPSCATSNCHVGSSAQAGLVLTADVAYENLVGVKPVNPNAIADGLKRVMIGKPDSSLLYHKLVFPPGHHAHDYGNPMPTGTAGLSNGQLEFVRQWIAAGAPKTGVVANASLLADKGLQNTQPFQPLSAPAAGTGFQLKVDQFDVSANFERELFNYRKVGNTSDIYVSRIETSMRPFSHHFVLYTFDPKTPSSVIPRPDVVRDIRKPDGSMDITNMIAMGYHVFLGGSMQPRSDYSFPAGTALRIPANTSIDLNVHYANHTSGKVDGEAYVNLYTTPAAQVLHPLSTLNLANYSIVLPAGQVTIVSKDFLFNALTTVTGLTSHMHARGTKFQIRIVGGARDGELVYENTDWEHPQLVNFTAPIVLSSGQGLRSIVTYNNTTTHPIFFGLTSDDEMDIIFGYYY